MTGSARLSTVACALVWTSAVLLRGVGVEAQYAPKPAADVPTYTRDVAPILYKNCTQCHRPGEIAPMSLLTYDEVRPWAKSIRDEVSDGTMPPWHADAPHGTFLNDRSLTAREKDVIAKWANGGAPKGDPKDMPPVPAYSDGWALGKPDAVFEMEEPYKLPADGTIQYEYFYIPTNFTEPKWVKSIEIRPSNREVVHHVLVYYRATPDLQRTPVFRPNAALARTPPEAKDKEGIHLNKPRLQGLPPRRMLATYAPGTSYQVAPEGTAFRLEPGGIIELQMHYTTKGETATDRTTVGFTFAKGEAKEIRPGQFFNGSFTLPAGEANVEVQMDAEFLQDATLWGIFPHTHLRGKKWDYKLILPDGTSKTILSVPKYDFNWQTYYMFKEPLQVPKGAKIVSTAWYDNSAGNKSNPDPKVDVKWGDQTWEEMQYTGVLFTPSQAPTPIVKQ
ncbi:MAG: thiol-disulfide isomerase [Acidobacteria bacterium]|nr:thiol-disulfide isomerase [Acidobacteriota bacterium]